MTAISTDVAEDLGNLLGLGFTDHQARTIITARTTESANHSKRLTPEAPAPATAPEGEYPVGTVVTRVGDVPYAASYTRVSDGWIGTYEGGEVMRLSEKFDRSITHGVKLGYLKIAIRP